MTPQPPELYSSDDDSDFENDGFHFSGDYDEVSDACHFAPDHIQIEL